MDLTEREILAEVAAGRLSPEEAADALANPPPADAPGPPPDPPSPNGGFRLKVSATARSVRIVGDVSVAEATVEGRHRAERTGDTLVVEGSVRPEEEVGFIFEGPGHWHRPWHHWRHLTEPLVIRVKPTVPVDVEVSAGSLNVQGMSGPLSVVVAAGSARLDDVTGPLEVEMRAGAVRISGRIEAHNSHIRCEAGSVGLHLDRGSDVTVRARADLGRVRVHGLPVPPVGGPTDSAFGGNREVTIGAGTATIDIETTMGSIELFSDEWLATSGDRR